MPVITISRGSYSRGKDVAEKLAKQLGYDCISREVILEASEQFNIPQLQLLKAVRDAPSILDRYRFGKERYVAYVRAALLRRVQRGDLVYHGFAGHFFLQQIPFALNVRILAGTEDRLQEVVRTAPHILHQGGESPLRMVLREIEEGKIELEPDDELIVDTSILGD